MTKRVFVEYLIEFVEPVPWSSIYKFEQDFADFFMAYGAEAQIHSVLEGGSGRRIITVTKVETFDPKNMMTQEKEQPRKAVADQVKDLKSKIPTGKRKGS